MPLIAEQRRICALGAEVWYLREDGEILNEASTFFARQLR
ncbi:hypothetical protein LHGZ1_2818 [Laribacter hongkongensis]|uniref:Uncharacterized protein n=1 Tax=Laribacter hongkongensis TaxID=168471 RepID=A0A248LMC8_9NEIS|nr:hypothetical protein LHGZ1_2818 [Laribacter hongkongensis]